MDYAKNEVNQNLLQNDVQKIIIVKQETRGSSNKPVLSVVDILLSVFVVTPLVVCAWRGAWGLMDIYALYFPMFPSFIVGMIIHVIFAICQDSLHNVIVETEKHWTLRIVSHFLRRFYTYLFLNVTILHWRGGWGLLDIYTGIQFNENGVVKWQGCHWVLLISASCYITLAFIRGLRNATAPPFAICLDKGNFVFRFPTMFRHKTDDNISLQMLDCIFSVGILGNLVVFFWRGMWVLVDVTLLPNDYVWSSWASLILGLLFVGLVYRLQNCMKNICARTSGISKVIVADFYITLSIIATIFFWRGTWFLLFIYCLPGNVELSCILTNLLGFMFLVVLGCSNSMLVRGVYKDGKGPNGECVVFPCQYLQIIMDQENPDDCDSCKQDLSEIKFITDLRGDSKG